MKKVTIKEPIYQTKTIQVGEREREYWVTSDGKEFDNESSASYHEFYDIKVNKRYVGFDGVNIFNFTSVEDLERYLKEYGYGIDRHDYDKEKLQFPNTYVLSEEYEINENYGYDEYGQPEKEDKYLRIYTFDEYKQKIIDELEGLRF